MVFYNDPKQDCLVLSIDVVLLKIVDKLDAFFTFHKTEAHAFPYSWNNQNFFLKQVNHVSTTSVVS